MEEVDIVMFFLETRMSDEWRHAVDLDVAKLGAKGVRCNSGRQIPYIGMKMLLGAIFGEDLLAELRLVVTCAQPTQVLIVARVAGSLALTQAVLSRNKRKQVIG